MLITVERYNYDYSPLARRFQELLLKPDVNKFYWGVVVVFVTLFLIQTLIISYIVRRLITRPIEELKDKIKKNDLKGPSLKLEL